jgi:histidinol-phosphate phosphatase family protein
MTRVLRAAAFIDKDGTLVNDEPYNVDPERVRLTPNAIEGLRLLAALGYMLVLVTNQPGIAMGRFDWTALLRLRQGLQRLLAAQGLWLAGFHACPHAPAGDGRPECRCRKPEPGLFEEAARDHGIDLAASWMIGDILDDVEAGHRAGCRTVLLDVGNETVWRGGPGRTPELRAADLHDAARQIAAVTGRKLLQPRFEDTRT